MPPLPKFQKFFKEMGAMTMTTPNLGIESLALETNMNLEHLHIAPELRGKTVVPGELGSTLGRSG